MGGSSSKDLTFSDFESTANNNDSKNKIISQNNSKNSKSQTISKKRSKTQSNQQNIPNSTSQKNSSQMLSGTGNTGQSPQSLEEITEKESEYKESHQEEENEEETENEEDEDNNNKEEENDEEEEYTQKDDDISNLKSFIENKKKQKKKGERLTIPRKSKNGEKYLEGDIEYKKIKRPETIKEESNEDEEEKSQQNGNQLDEVEQLKKKKMLKEYDFYLTKEIPKNKFINKNKNSNLPMDFADVEEKKNQEKKYLCFIEAKTKKKKKIEIKPDKTNQIIRDEIYLFNERRKQIKSIKPLTQDEYLKPYSYKVEFEIGKKGISNKVINKINENGQNEYIDVYPNGEGYKFKPNDSDEEEKKEEIKKVAENIVTNETLTNAQIEEIKKNDENNIVNIINKGLKENKLVEEVKAANDNDF